MTWLIACEYSGTVRDAFLAEGIDAVSCDLLPTESEGPHIVGDVRDQLARRWSGVIAHPPCTRLANSGVRWLEERNLWDELKAGAELFRACLNANAHRVAVENPIMHKHALALVGQKHSFTVQPYQFGDPVRKRTCWWTRGLPPLAPTSDMKKEDAEQTVWLMSPGPERAKERARFFPGMATAIARQWGHYEPVL